MNINPIDLNNVHIHLHGESDTPLDSADTGQTRKSKRELYSKDDSAAIRASRLYQVKSPKPYKAAMQEEGIKLKGKSISILAEAEEIKAEGKKLKGKDQEILRYAHAMQQNAKSLYEQASSRINKTGKSFIGIKRQDGKTDTIFTKDGSVHKIFMGFDGKKAEHAFVYDKNAVLYFRNPNIKDAKITGADEEYLFHKGDFIKYSKNTAYDLSGCETSFETRYYKNGGLEYVSLNNDETRHKKTSDKTFYYLNGEIISFVQGKEETGSRTEKNSVYNFIDGNLSSYAEKDGWENNKNHSALKMTFENGDIKEAFVNNTMSPTSYQTSEKQFLYKNDSLIKARTNYERTSIGGELFEDEYIF